MEPKYKMCIRDRDIVINDKDFIKIQKQHINPCKVDKNQVEQFRQKILENETKRDYAIVTIILYMGLRISECLNIQMNDFDIDRDVYKRQIYYYSHLRKNGGKRKRKERKTFSISRSIYKVIRVSK